MQVSRRGCYTYLIRLRVLRLARVTRNQGVSGGTGPALFLVKMLTKELEALQVGCEVYHRSEKVTYMGPGKSGRPNVKKADGKVVRVSPTFLHSVESTTNPWLK